MRVEISDLCYSCRQLPSNVNGMSVEDFLNAIYSMSTTDPRKYVELGGDAGVTAVLSNAIVMGNGCTTCGAIVLDKARKLGLPVGR